MSTNRGRLETILPKYDDDRRKSFIQRAMHRYNLPIEYRPQDDCNKTAFVDALIGLYLDSAEERHVTQSNLGRYEQELARVVLTIRFLEGEDLEVLRADMPDFEKGPYRNKRLTEYVLGVAGEGARTLRNNS